MEPWPRSVIAGWCIRTRTTREARRFRRPYVEHLEDRRLLTAGDLPAPPFAAPSLALDVRDHRPDSLIVQFRDGMATPGSLAAYLLTANLEPEWSLTPGMRKVNLSSSADLATALLKFQQDPNVAFAEPDYRVSTQLLPNDPAFPSQYNLNNSGQSGGIADADIDAPEAWDITTGDHDTIVAVIDTGVDYTHPDLADNMWTNTAEANGRPGVDDDHNGYIDDIHGYDFVNHDGDPMDDNFHGTHVAGTIGAVGNNHVGVAGVNWHVQIMALKFLDSAGGGYESDAIAALNYAVANGAVVSNNSWGGIGFSQAFQTAIQNAADHGHIFVAAAGNDSSNNDTRPFYPASYDVPNVISVAATDDSDALAYFSNYGANSVDLAAPGVNILSTFPTTITPAMRDKGFNANYGTLSGTSMATPHVTGVVALVRSLHPDWAYDEVIQQILGSVDVIPNLQTITSGRVNAAGAVGNPAPDTSGPRVIGSDPSTFAFGSIDHIRIRFSEAIDPTTVSLADVQSFASPAGSIPVISIAPVPNSSRLFDITFTPQTAVGVYQLVIGPDINDKAGNPMNQDGDDQFGEVPDDQYTMQFLLREGAHFESANVPMAFLGYSIAGNPLYIGQDVIIGDLNVTLDIAYPDVSDLIILLISPSGTGVALSFLDGAEGPGFVNTTFDDEASLSIMEGTSPFTGSFRPHDPTTSVSQVLAQFDGESALGVWQLWIENFAFTDAVGILNSWSIDINPVAGGPPPDDNQPPVANNDTIDATSNAPLTFDASVLLANDFDPDGDTITIVGVQPGSGGTVEITNNTTITYTPDEGFIGTGDFYYMISDGFATAIGHVTVNVLAQTLWHNHVLAVDVDNDGRATANDVITIINVLNSVGSTSLLGLSGSFKPAFYLDVTADNFVGPDDVLAVINYINSNPDQPSSTAITTTRATPPPTTTNIDAALLSLLTENSDKKK